MEIRFVFQSIRAVCIRTIMLELIEPRGQHEQNMNKKYSVKFIFRVQLFTITLGWKKMIGYWYAGQHS